MNSISGKIAKAGNWSEREVLSIEDLEVGFASNELAGGALVCGLNLKIFSGETLALVGESGCGKTTVALAILRLIDLPGQISGGKILYQNENLLLLNNQRLRQIRWKEIAMIFQEPSSALNPLRRVGSQVMEVLRCHLGLDTEAARQRTLQLFESVSLPEPTRCFHSYPHELSSGMQQRAMIAMAIACQPKLLIADEPTTALDAHNQQHVLNCLLHRKQALRASLLFISHDLSLVSKFADRLAVMHQGQIVEVGTTAQMLAQPRHHQTRRLLEAAKRFGKDTLVTSRNTGADIEPSIENM